MTNEELLADFIDDTRNCFYINADIKRRKILSRMLTTEQMAAYRGLVEAMRKFRDNPFRYVDSEHFEILDALAKLEEVGKP